MSYRRLSFVDAAHTLGEPIEPATPLERKPPAPISEPPDWNWQHAAERVVSLAEETLWSITGEPALCYLMGRGLSSATIRKGRLGYIPGDYRQRRTMEGLEVPCGITIPWFAAGVLWAVKVRRAYGMPKYLQITGGSAAGLYKAEDLATAEIALFCEGEFDALLADQEVGSLAAAVTLGSAVNALSARWFGELIHCRLMLVSYDRDEAGERATQRLLNLSPRFHRITLPHGKDITEFFLRDGNIYQWVESQLDSKQPEHGSLGGGATNHG
jgi:DNA primase